MQPLARNNLAGAAMSAAQITSLIRDTNALGISAGLELLDITLTVLADLTDSFDGGSVGRDAYATLHGAAQLNVAQELNWGTAILRPYMIMDDGANFVRFNLGAYLASSPKAVVGDLPATNAIDGFDILHWLNTPVGEAYVVNVGTAYLDAVEQILLAQGIVAYLIDRQRASSVLPVARTWVMDTQTTWLKVVNDLLAAIGYQGLWSDWDGNLRATPYQNPGDRSFEWLYDSRPTTSMLAPTRIIDRDFFAAPNRWVFYTSADPSGPAPVEGAGVYTFVNNTQGPSSVVARGGRVITAPPQQVDAVDQAALIALAQITIDADIRLMTTYEMETAPNPTHWHFDVLAVDDPGLGPLSNVLGTKWTLPLDGGDMTQEWSVL